MLYDFFTKPTEVTLFWVVATNAAGILLALSQIKVINNLKRTDSMVETLLMKVFEKEITGSSSAEEAAARLTAETAGRKIKIAKALNNAKPRKVRKQKLS